MWLAVLRVWLPPMFYRWPQVQEVQSLEGVEGHAASREVDLKAAEEEGTCAVLKRARLVLAPAGRIFCWSPWKSRNDG